MNPDPFADLISNEPSPQSTKTVPNIFPKITNTPYHLAIIGESPNSDELSAGIPFYGHSGREFNKILDRGNFLRDACFLGNVCQHQPPGGKFAYLNWEGPEITSGIEKLTHDLSTLRPVPNLLWLLGASSLHLFKCGRDNAPSKRKTKEGPVFN